MVRSLSIGKSSILAPWGPVDIKHNSWSEKHHEPDLPKKRIAGRFGSYQAQRASSLTERVRGSQ